MEEKLTPTSMYENLKNMKVPEGPEVLKFLSSGKGAYFEVLRRYVLSQIHTDEHLYKMIAEATNTTYDDDLALWYLIRPEKDVFPKNKEQVPIIDKNGKLKFIDKLILNKELKGKYDEASILVQMLSGDSKRWDEITDFVCKYYDSNYSKNYENWRKQIEMGQSKQRCKDILTHNQSCQMSIEEMNDNLNQIEQQMNGLVPVTKNPIKRILQNFKNKKTKKELESSKSETIGKISDLEKSMYSEEYIRTSLLQEVDDVQMNNAETEYMKRLVGKRRCYTENCPIEDLLRLYNPTVNDYDTAERFMREAGNLVNDVRSHILIMQKMYSPELLQEKSLEETCKKIREMMLDSEVVFDSGRKRDTDYRDRTDMKSTNFIKGAKLSKQQISHRMKELESKYAEAMQCESTEEYIRKCADLHMEFAMLHPYEDGNGRTARALLNVMLGKRDILLPSLYDTYVVDRGPNGVYTKAGNEAAKAEPNFQYFQDYLISRIQKFNPQIEGLREFTEKTKSNEDNVRE